MPPETVEVPAAKLEQAVEGLTEATKKLNDSRTNMEKLNGRVDELLKKQEAIESGRNEDKTSLADIKKELAALAQQMEDTAKQHTELVHTTRTFMKQSASINTDGGTERDGRGAYKYRGQNSKGALFASRQQAMELGAFLLATMKRDAPIKQYATRWLQDHKQDLRYLPQIPRSLIQEVSGQWLESFKKLENGKAWLQDLSGSATPGSVLVHPAFADTLIRNVEEHGKFRQNALIWPMGSDVVHIPKRTSGLSVYWEGEAEGGSETDVNFTLLSMTAKKMMMLHQFSSELRDDAFIEIADIFMFEASLAIAQEEDRIGFNGTGAGGNSPGYAGFWGVLGATAHATEATAIANNVPRLITGAAGADLATEITVGKLRAMQGACPTWARAGAKWYGHRTVLSDVGAIETSGGGPLVDFSEGMLKKVLGDVWEEVDQMPASPGAASTKILAYGDLRKSWILGDRRSVEIETSEHYAFNTDQLTTRVKARIGFLRAQADGMVVYSTGTA